jgi:SAM-dependent methyltransferase
MISVTCYNCGDDSTIDYSQENGYKLVACESCGLLYVNPRPDDKDISSSAKTGVHQGENLIDVTGKFSYKKVNNYINVLKDIFGIHLPLNVNSWLDIGCGHGELLLAIQNFGTDRKIWLKGLEPNDSKRQSALKHNLDVSNFNLSEHCHKYDVVSLLNVYSHLPNPPQFIAEFISLLNPGGMILLETGDTAHLSADEQLRPFYLPDHLSFASQKIVVDILERSNFEILVIKKYPAIKFSITRLLKESANLVIPNKVSNFQQLLRYQKYADIDMYILARLKS